MYANLRQHTIARPLVIVSLIVASLLVGSASGYAIATARAFSVTPQSAAQEQAPGSLASRSGTFRTSEHQGSSENANAAPASVPNDTFLATEHQGSAENPNAAVTSGPGNIAFLTNEHQGSPENPDATDK